MIDYSQTNSGLHRLYVMWAMRHLKILKKSLKALQKYSECYTNNSWNVVFRERKRLLESHPAYQEAAWRMLAGQTLREVEGQLKIFDHWTQDFVPIGTPAKTDTETPSEPGYINLDTKAAITTSVESLSHAQTRIKSRTNKLTSEQRRQNGRAGATKRDENRRQTLARDDKKFYLYGIFEANGVMRAKYKLIGRPHHTMRTALRAIKNNDNIYDTFAIYDNKGRRWNYDAASGSMHLVID